ncbi:DUF4386 domain-containing protein [uncultured Phycicoccus sp.]|uniref:DUF4386 domain-containing protein n=1 Tax=uncultured Phycicoccus sp. TaxID=661422 RepID=UPI00262A0363|nr:DUF4386 domain-containing protein [uncultured Phycicoccus sp.]
MTIITASGSRAEAITPEPVRTARTTGLLYLGLVVTGLLGFGLVRGQLFVADDPAATLANLTEHETVARLGIVLETGIVLTQALVAVWFYRLFRSVHTFAAGSIAAFGLVNSVAILGSAAMLATALDVSQDASLAVSGGAAATVQLLYVVSGHLWLIGGIFFGLWLIPMGWLARRSAWMPGLLGWLLMIGGVGYVANALFTYLLPDAGLALDLLTVPTTIGELWMVAYLCLRGVRRPLTSGGRRSRAGA